MKICATFCLDREAFTLGVVSWKLPFSFPNDFSTVDILLLSPFAWFTAGETKSFWSLASSSDDDSSDKLWILLLGETDTRPFVRSLYLSDSVRTRFRFDCGYGLSDTLPFVAEYFLFNWDDSGTGSGDVSTKQVTLVENYMVIHNKISLSWESTCIKARPTFSKSMRRIANFMGVSAPK